MYKQLKRMRQEEGFTLIELLIVIVILGVLAGIVVFSVAGITDRGKKSACDTDLATVNTAIEAYYAVNNAYPGAASDLYGKFIHGTSLPADVSYAGGATATSVPSPCSN